MSDPFVYSHRLLAHLPYIYMYACLIFVCCDSVCLLSRSDHRLRESEAELGRVREQLNTAHSDRQVGVGAVFVLFFLSFRYCFVCFLACLFLCLHKGGERSKSFHLSIVGLVSWFPFRLRRLIAALHSLFFHLVHRLQSFEDRVGTLSSEVSRLSSEIASRDATIEVFYVRFHDFAIARMPSCAPLPFRVPPRPHDYVSRASVSAGPHPSHRRAGGGGRAPPHRGVGARRGPVGGSRCVGVASCRVFACFFAT